MNWQAKKRGSLPSLTMLKREVSEESKNSRSTVPKMNPLGFIKRKMKGERSTERIDRKHFESMSSSCSAKSLKSVVSALSSSSHHPSRPLEKSNSGKKRLFSYYDNDKGDFNLAACAFAREGPSRSEEFLFSFRSRRSIFKNDKDRNGSTRSSRDSKKSSMKRLSKHSSELSMNDTPERDEATTEDSTTLYVDFPSRYC